MTFSLSVKKTNTDYTGWQSASLTRSIEQPAASFSFSAPHPQLEVDLKVQNEIEISTENNILCSGKIFKITGTSDEGNATRSFSGRSTIADAIDSSAPIEQTFWKDISAKEIITQLLAPFDITAKFEVQVTGTTELRINPGDSVWQAIDKLLQKENLLAYELEPGILTISRAPSSGSVASLEFGTSDITSLTDYSLDISNRYSKYLVVGEGILGSAIGAKGEAQDNNIKNRPLIIQLTGNVDDARCQQVADYESQIRAARSLSFSYRVPSWYNNAGELWTPNTRINIIDAENDINGEHLLVAVTLNENENDTWAVLKFAAPESYTLTLPPPADESLFSV